MSGPMDAWDEALRETNRADAAERRAEAAEAEVARLTADRDLHCKRADDAETEASQATADLAEVTAERNEAQREVCKMVSDAARDLPLMPRANGPEHVAAFRGWKCYPK